MSSVNPTPSFQELCRGQKLKEGIIEKKDRKGFVPYYALLKSNFLFFFSTDKKAQEDRKYLGFLQLSHDTECIQIGVKKAKHKWEFEMRIESRKIFLFRCKTEVEMNDWMSAVYKALPASPYGASFADEAAGFKTYRDSRNAIEDGVVHRVVPKRSQSLAGSVVSRRSKPRHSSIETKNESVPTSLSTTPGYDPVVLYFRWYYPKMTRQKAEDILLEQELGTYLLRDSESSRYPDFYTLSFRDSDRIKHHKIEPRESGDSLTYVFQGDERLDFKTPGDAVVFLMSSKQGQFQTKPYVLLQPGKAKETTVASEAERTSGDGMEVDVFEDEDEYLEPVSNNEYLRQKFSDWRISCEETNKQQGRRKSATSLPLPPFPDPPSSEQLERGLFGDYVNFDAMKMQRDRDAYVNIRQLSPSYVVPLPERSTKKYANIQVEAPVEGTDC